MKKKAITDIAGFAPIIIWVLLALLGGGALVLKPKFLSGDSKRADASQAATAKVEVAVNAQGAAAAAGVVKIGEANTMAPDSPSKSFIASEVPAVLAKLPAPDPVALLEAEKRRSAVMEGRLAEAKTLYGQETVKSAHLQAERDAALAARRAVDLQLSEAAALKLGAERQSMIYLVIAILAAALWVYSKVYGISPASIGAAMADIRAGVNPVAALDTHLAPWLHKHVAIAAKLASTLPDATTVPPTT